MNLREPVGEGHHDIKGCQHKDRVEERPVVSNSVLLVVPNTVATSLRITIICKQSGHKISELETYKLHYVPPTMGSCAESARPGGACQR